MSVDVVLAFLYLLWQNVAWQKLNRPDKNKFKKIFLISQKSVDKQRKYMYNHQRCRA